MGAFPEWNSCSREDKRNAETFPQRMSQKNVKEASTVDLRALLQGDGIVAIGRRLNRKIARNRADKRSSIGTMRRHPWRSDALRVTFTLRLRHLPRSTYEDDQLRP